MKKIFVVLLMCFLTATSAFARPIEKVVYFGDSLTDNGNLNWVLKFFPKSPPYFKGRFSNGPVWSDTVQNILETKYGIKSENFAVGGSTVEFHNPIDGFLPYVLAQEINHYILETPFSDRSKILFVLWIGANDYTTPGSRSNASDVTDKIISSVNTLISHGAKNFMILNLPDLGKTPYGQPLGLGYYSKQHNSELLKRVRDLKEKNKNITVSYFDIYNMFNDIFTNVDAYNTKYNKHLTDLTTSCWTGGYTLQKDQNNAMRSALESQLNQAVAKNKMTADPVDTKKLADYIMSNASLNEAYTAGYLYSRGVTPCNNPEEHVFWDHIHPSSTMHDILAQEFINKLLEDKFIS